MKNVNEGLGWAWSDKVDQKRGEKEAARKSWLGVNCALMKWKFINEYVTASSGILQFYAAVNNLQESENSEA